MSDPYTGERIRTRVQDGSSRRALLLCYQGKLCEVEFEEGGEEALVPVESIQPLEAFECKAAEAESAKAEAAETGLLEVAECRKAEGNALFKLRDYAAALERYVRGLRALHRSAPPSVGGHCIVKAARETRLISLKMSAEAASRSSRSPRYALVLALDTEGADVLYEDEKMPEGELLASGGISEVVAELVERAAALGDGLGRDEGEALSRNTIQEIDEEEETVELARLVPVHPIKPALQVALLLNMARCSFATGNWASALERAARAELMASRHEASEPDVSVKLLDLRRSALIVGARAALGTRRFRGAIALAGRLLAAPLPAAPAAAVRELCSLLKEIGRRSAEVQRSNRKLSKGLSEWVQVALQQAAAKESQSQGDVAEASLCSASGVVSQANTSGGMASLASGALVAGALALASWARGPGGVANDEGFHSGALRTGAGSTTL